MNKIARRFMALNSFYSLAYYGLVATFLLGDWVGKYFTFFIFNLVLFGAIFILLWVLFIINLKRG